MAQPRYKVIERIDAGGMAEVFKANSTSMQGFEKLVAIKRILPSLTQNERFVRMFLDEAKVSLHLNHTNCVHVFDLGIADGTYFIVMEFVNGTNLKKVIEFLDRKGRQMPLELAVFVAIEVCKGLTHAHEKTDQSGKPLDIVHRDISPPNVLISRAGEVKITDFGLAKAKSQAEVTDPGVVKGKFGYLSPEAAHGEEVDARTDIFAVGILLWEMLAGQRLFLGESDFATLQEVRKAKIPPLSKHRNDIPPGLEKVLRRALTKDPTQRFQTAEELARELAIFLFAHGQVVTNYDLAGLVLEVVEQRPRRARTAADAAVDAAVQQQLNQLKSLEEIDDLDLYMAQNYDSLPDQGEASHGGADGNFEDPRMWDDVFGGEPVTTEVPADLMNKAVGGEPDSWQAAGLSDIAHSTSAYKAIKAPATKEKKNRPGPPTLPGGIPTPSPTPTPSPSPDALSPAPQAAPTPAPHRATPAPTPAPGPASAPPRARDEVPVTPRRERAQTPVVSKKSGATVGVTTLIVTAVVVVLGLLLLFALGLLPPD